MLFLWAQQSLHFVVVCLHIPKEHNSFQFKKSFDSFDIIGICNTFPSKGLPAHEALFIILEDKSQIFKLAGQYSIFGP